jgi:hypothetical protein
MPRTNLAPIGVNPWARSSTIFSLPNKFNGVGGVGVAIAYLDFGST